jgi:peroxiredoxin
MNLNKPFESAFQIVAVLLVLSISACSVRSNDIVIKGRIEGANNVSILLREAGNDRISILDSTRSDSNGEFEFLVSCNQPQFVILQVEGRPDPQILLVEPGEKIKIQGRVNEPSKNYIISGSKGSKLVRDLNLRLEGVVTTIDSLSKYFRNSVEHPKFDSIKKAIDTAYVRTIQNHKNYTENFIKENRYSLASILALYQQYDKSTFVLNKREDFELFKLVDEALYPLYSSNPLVENLHSNVRMIGKQLKLYDRREEMIDEGETLPDLLLTLASGESIKISELRSRYILIDFWALWCNDCKSNNQKLKAVYNKYSSKGFQIIQVSLDQDKKILTDWMKSDSIQWLMVSDFLQWDSPILDSLSINSIPSNYLIDRNRIVKSRNIRPNELDIVLSKYLP